MNRFFIVSIVSMASVVSMAQTAKDVQTILPGRSNVNIAYDQEKFSIPVRANNAYTVSEDADWLTCSKNEDGSRITFSAQTNSESLKRTANITLTSEDGGMTRNITITQGREQTAESVPTSRIYPTKYTASSSNSGEGVERLFDDNTSTLWHSNYSGGGFPITIDLTFKGTEKMDYMEYVTRSSQTNGNWKEVELWVQQSGESSLTKYGSYNFNGENGTHKVEFETPITPVKMQLKIKSGANNFASGAELGFYINKVDMADFDIFDDDLFTTLKPGTTQADIDALTNPFCKLLAGKLFKGEYDTTYRVAEYPCRLSYNVLSDEWNAPGKYYSQLDNPTGINFYSGDTKAVLVSGIPDGMSVKLDIVAWWVGKEGNNFDGGNPHTTSFTLHNGVNRINYNYEWDGLGYICYYADTREAWEAGIPNIKVHFALGSQNGILTPDKSNEEMYQLCKNAPNYCMDLYGSKVQSVWTSEGLTKYCKASDGTSYGYRQYLNLLDSLIMWEHRVLGFEKYNRMPDNHTMAYVNFTYYMFQGGLGVSFHRNQEKRVLNCKTLMYNDYDAIWGLSHEWGHQHQMTPYLCWSGMSEVSNNIMSYYNVHHMGYSYGVGKTVRKHFWDHDSSDIDKYSTRRHDIYEYVSGSSSAFNYSSDLRNACLAEKDSTIYDFDKNPTRAASIYDFDVFEILSPLVFLMNYATIKMDYEDFYPDLFEAMRQEDDLPGGSTIEKQDGFDKYELIAAAQNGNKNGLYSKLVELYPNSCWVKQNYLNKGNTSYYDNSVPACFNYIRKASRLYGYNLWKFFERVGFLRVAAFRIGDYGTKHYILTQKMYDEFKEDMDQLETDGVVKPLSDEMLYDIFHIRDFNNSSTDRMYPTPEIPN